MKLKEEYIVYAKRLKTIGELIEEISKLIDIGRIESIKEAIPRFEYAGSALSEVDVPKAIEKEHNDLVKSLEQWNLATKQAAGLKSEYIVKSALGAQKEYEVKIVKITDEIVKIIRKHL